MTAQAALEVAGTSHAFAVAFALLGELLALLFVYRVLVRGGSPASTLLWVVVILAAPWLGLLLYFLFPRRLHLRRLRRLRARSARYHGVRGPAARGKGRSPRGSGLAAVLAGPDGAGLSGGNHVSWLATAGEFLAAATTAIEAARLHVHCVVYIFRADASGVRFLELLTAAARRGVKVRLLFDSFGSFGLSASYLTALRAAGGEARAFLPLLWKRRPFTVNLRNHRKLLVVDGETGFVGGRNIGDEYLIDRSGNQRRWLDAMLALRGPAAEQLQDVFVQDWCTATDEVLADTFVLPAAHGHSAVGIVCSGPDREQSDLWFALIQAIGEAEREIDLSSPYLVPPPFLLFALSLAAARGVLVRLHTNGPRSEAAILYHAQRSWYRRFLAAGIEIHETIDDYNHAKVVVVDGRTVIVGSANMDLRSAHLNFEVAAVIVGDRALAAQVTTTLAQLRAGCRRITTADLPARPLSRAIDGLCGLLSPVL